jgi:hypothetical protein
MRARRESLINLPPYIVKDKVFNSISWMRSKATQVETLTGASRYCGMLWEEEECMGISVASVDSRRLEHTWMQKGEEVTVSIQSGPTLDCCPCAKIGTGGRPMPEHDQEEACLRIASDQT